MTDEQIDTTDIPPLDDSFFARATLRMPARPAPGDLSSADRTAPTVDKYDWRRLSKLQVGRYAAYYVKMEFTLHGFDVYGTEVDDRGIDCVVRKGPDTYYDVQVKAMRGFGYLYFPKEKFPPRPNLFAAIVLLQDGQPPDFYLIPSRAWETPDALFADRDYRGLKSVPEWGLKVSKRNLPRLDAFRFERTVGTL